MLLSEVCMSSSSPTVRDMFPLRTTLFRHPLPHVDGFPALGVLWDDPTPQWLDHFAVSATFSFSILRSNQWIAGSLTENQWGLPGSLMLLFTHATVLTTPADPPEPCLKRFLCIGFQRQRGCHHLL